MKKLHGTGWIENCVNQTTYNMWTYNWSDDGNFLGHLNYSVNIKVRSRSILVVTIYLAAKKVQTQSGYSADTCIIVEFLTMAQPIKLNLFVVILHQATYSKKFLRVFYPADTEKIHSKSIAFSGTKVCGIERQVNFGHIILSALLCMLF